MSIVWHKIKIVLGLAFCVVGVAGALVPVIPGMPILLAGVALIGTDHWLVVNLRNWLKRRRDGR
ncbi:MAG: hypothetical protein ACM3TN_26420 [Alphaproteobacteria bacterium]